MANFAVLSGSSVVNVIVATSKKNAELATKAECVEYKDENPAGIGWSYIDGLFIAPIPIEVTPDGIA
jgi:hypothetical protein